MLINDGDSTINRLHTWRRAVLTLLTAIHFAFLFGTIALWLPFTASTQVVEDLFVSEWVRFPLYLELKKIRMPHPTLFFELFKSINSFVIK